MYVLQINPTTSRVMPAIKKTAAKTTRNATKKLSQLSFDVKPNKLVSEQKRNAHKILCEEGSGGSYHSLGSCDDVMLVDLYAC